MSLNIIRPKNETEDSLLSVTKVVKRLLNKLMQNRKIFWNLN